MKTALDKPAESLQVEPLTATVFAAFGQVVAVESSGGRLVNGGTARRFDDLAALNADHDQGGVMVSLFEVEAIRLPLAVEQLERHKRSSQLFMPLQHHPFLVVVAPGFEQPTSHDLRCFLSDGQQGVNYAAGVWHHPVLALRCGATFIVIASAATAGTDCELSAGVLGCVRS